MHLFHNPLDSNPFREDQTNGDGEKDVNGGPFKSSREFFHGGWTPNGLVCVRMDGDESGCEIAFDIVTRNADCRSLGLNTFFFNRRITKLDGFSATLHTIEFLCLNKQWQFNIKLVLKEFEAIEEQQGCRLLHGMN